MPDPEPLPSVDRLHRLRRHLEVLGMACEAIEDGEQRKAMISSVATAQEVVAQLISDLEEETEKRLSDGDGAPPSDHASGC